MGSSQASKRQIILIRHGQYASHKVEDKEKVLTPLGELQASHAGVRLLAMLENRTPSSSITKHTRPKPPSKDNKMDIVVQAFGESMLSPIPPVPQKDTSVHNHAVEGLEKSATPSLVTRASALKLHSIWCSDQTRAKQTAVIIARALGVREEEIQVSTLLHEGLPCQPEPSTTSAAQTLNGMPVEKKVVHAHRAEQAFRKFFHRPIVISITLSLAFLILNY